jgi:serine/threonine-protein kinase
MGRFRPIRLHARGGRGEVFLASDEELRRQVALKEIQPHLVLDARERSKFEFEAEVTGGLEHPAIIPVYGLGHYPDGRPFYAMRFIEGESLKEAAARFHGRDGDPRRDPAERSLALRELLERFQDVCDAIGYAHSRGVLHRDIKPGNIMLGPFGETLVVDWGLAKLLAGKTAPGDENSAPWKPLALELPEATERGTIVGTPAYMSPEQARGEVDRLGPATDVYSLGATLSAILVDRSTTPAALPVSDLVRRVAAGEVRSPRALDARVPRALDAICRKAMAFAPQDRYASPAGLKADIRRWLADEPVTVWREPWPGRMGRWARRHRMAVAAAVLVLVFGTVAATIVAWERTRNARALDIERRTAVAGERHAIDAVRRFRDAVEANPELKNNPALAPLRRTLLKEPLAFFQSLRDQLYQEKDPSRESLSRLGTAAYELGMLTYSIGDRRDAARAFDEALQVREQLVHRESSVPEFQKDLAQTLHAVGNMQSEAGDLARGLQSYGKARAIWKRLVTESPLSAEYRVAYAKTLANIGISENLSGRLAEALATEQEARDLLERLASEHPRKPEIRKELAGRLNSIAVVQARMGWFAAALDTAQRARAHWERLVREHPAELPFQEDLAGIQYNIGNLFSELGRLEEALPAYRASLATRQRLLDAHPSATEYRRNLAVSHYGLAGLLRDRGEHEEARARYRAAIEILGTLAHEHPSVEALREELGTAYGDLATLERTVGQNTEALASYGRALAIQERLAHAHPESCDNNSAVASTLGGMAEVELAENHPDRAGEMLQRAIAYQRKALTACPDRPAYRERLADHYEKRIAAARALGRNEEAAAAGRELERLRSSK